ncbi:MAG TPA: hypothetical protein VGJ60_07335 [Chloroflexota bacterium]|jgi:hypothetical protein
MSFDNIADIVEQAAGLAMQVRRAQRKDLAPMLHLVTFSGQVEIAALAFTGDGHMMAHTMRQALLLRQPKHAVLMMEGWTARKDLSRDDPDMRALMAGVLTPSRLPPHKRGEMLTAIGESASGEQAYAMNYIEPDGSFSEMMASWKLTKEQHQAQDGLATHMYPMFLDHYLLRQIPSELRAVLVEHLGSEKKLLHMVNRACRKWLASVGPEAEPAEYSKRMDELVTRMREDIGWRKRDAS